MKSILFWIWATGFYITGMSLVVGAIWLIYVLAVLATGHCPPGADC